MNVSSRSRLILKTAIVLSAACAIACNDVGGPGPFIDSPDTTGTDTIPARDRTPPQAVTDAVLTLAGDAYEIRLAWTAPHDDSVSEAVTSYRIRYSLSYTAMQYWDLSMPVFDPPAPAPPGSPQQCGGFDFFERGKNVYAAIKSVDEAGNESALGNIASLHIPGYRLTGICMDAVSKHPAAGLSVRLLAGLVINLESGADGTFERNDLPRDIYLSISTGVSPVAFHAVTEPLRLSNDSTHAVPMIRYEPVQSGEYPSLLGLFKVLLRTTASDPSAILRKWKRMPVRCHIPPYVNGYGVDYGARAREAAQRWMDATGWELFTFVDAPPDTGVAFEYRTAEEMGILRGITEHTDGSDGLPLRDTIALANYFSDSSFLYRVCLHEIGHAIRLGHVNTRSYIMYAGQPLPNDISSEELAVVELLRGLPNLTDMALYDDTPP